MKTTLRSYQRVRDALPYEYQDTFNGIFIIMLEVYLGLGLKLAWFKALKRSYEEMLDVIKRREAKGND